MNPTLEKKPIRCPLCGQRFVPEASRCASCPLAGKGCERVCCPNCRYSFPAESKVANWFLKLWKTGGEDHPKESKS
jgi:hypothetical protein